MNGKKFRIAVLYDVWEGEEEPTAEPEAEQAPARGRRRRKKKQEKADREEVFEALEKLGYEPFYYALDGRDQTLLGVAKCGADLVFNLTESYAGDDTKDMNVAAYLDLLGLPYTGSNGQGLFLGHDKVLAKKLFAFHGIRTPKFATSYRGVLDHAHDVVFPLIVKPSAEDGSIGIHSSSVVGSVKELMEQTHYIHDEFDSPVLIEEYIEGREIYVAILGNKNPEALPLIELDLSKLPKGTPRIAGEDVKWEKETQAYKVTKSAPVEDMDEDTVHKVQETALAAYQALKLRDYGRIDLRLGKKDRAYVIEANPNPWLSSSAEFAMAARKSGRNYTQMIGAIVDLARARYAAG